MLLDIALKPLRSFPARLDESGTAFRENVTLEIAPFSLLRPTEVSISRSGVALRRELYLISAGREARDV